MRSRGRSRSDSRAPREAPRPPLRPRGPGTLARGTLHVVATPLGNLEDLSPRAARVLGEVDLVLAEDTRRTGALLAHLGHSTRMSSVHEHNERDRAAEIVLRLQAGETMALVSDAGTPTLSDPGFPLVRACVAAGVPVVPVPGPSALIAALSVAGLPTDRVLFLGFLPGRPGRRRRALVQALSFPATVVLYLSPHRLLRELDLLVDVAGSGRPACLAREMTKIYEEFEHGTLSELRARWAQRKPLGEFVIVIGPPCDDEGDNEEAGEDVEDEDDGASVPEEQGPDLVVPEDLPHPGVADHVDVTGALPRGGAGGLVDDLPDR